MVVKIGSVVLLQYIKNQIELRKIASDWMIFSLIRLNVGILFLRWNKGMAKNIQLQSGQ